MKNTGSIFLFILLIAAGLIAAAFLYPSSHRYGGLHFPVDRNMITERGIQTLDAMNLSTTELRFTISVKKNRSLFRSVQREFGVREGNAVMRETVPVFYWDLRWSDIPVFPIGIEFEGDAPQMFKSPSVDLRLRMDGRGNLLRFSQKIHDTIALPSVSIEEARTIAVDFTASVATIDLTEYTLDLERTLEKDQRKDHTFLWTREHPSLKQTETITVELAGTTPKLFQKTIDFPSPPGTDFYITLKGILSPLVYILLGIIMLVMGIRRIRAREMGFSIAVVLAVIVGLCVFIDLMMKLLPMFEWLLLIPIIFGPLFAGGFFILVWAVTESVGRETWKDKFVSFDFIANGHLLHSSVGYSLLAGICTGTVLYALLQSVLALVDSITPIHYIITDGNDIEYLGTVSPVISIIANTLYLQLYIGSVLIIFLLSALRQKISPAPVLILLGALIFVFAHWQIILPLSLGIIITGVLGTGILWSFYRFDAITIITGLFTYFALDQGFPMILSANDYLFQQGVLLSALFVAIGVYSVTALSTKDKTIDTDVITPKFERYISERQRLQREIEIAREVQMSFLPKSSPVVPPLDIAGRCIPATEVGGDYYDFIFLNPEKLGIVIGDVSGKGTKAAFYMTLMKGFIRAAVATSQLPTEVLTFANQLFYENVERGAFVSMLYGTFDIAQKQFTFARAGHNPPLLKRAGTGEVEVLQPNGLALGLENGPIFNRIIEETKIHLHTNDIVVLYTDGLTEAINSRKVEFGTDRLIESLKRKSTSGAAEIMEGIFQDIYSFTGRVPPIDDMTMVVVKME